MQTENSHPTPCQRLTHTFATPLRKSSSLFRCWTDFVLNKYLSDLLCRGPAKDGKSSHYTGCNFLSNVSRVSPKKILIQVGKYDSLVSNCHRQGWKARRLPVEVGCRGSLCRAYTASPTAPRWLSIICALLLLGHKPTVISLSWVAWARVCDIGKHPMTPGNITDDVP